MVGGLLSSVPLLFDFTGTKKIQKNISISYPLFSVQTSPKREVVLGASKQSRFCFLYSEQKHKNLRDESASCVFPR